MRRTRWHFAGTVLACLLLVAGCSRAIAGRAEPGGTASGGDRGLVEQYYNELNESGTEGTSAQREFLRRTQHPDYTDRLCDLGELTLHIDPAMSTFRPDPKWSPPDSTGGEHPRGTIYVVAVSISVRQQGALLGEQIASQRVVILDGKAYGFAPCLN